MKVLFALLSALVWFTYLAQYDDPLSPDAVRLLEMANQNTESEAYLYMTGIYAAEGESPIEVGRDLFEQYQLKQQDPSFEVTPYPESRKLGLPQLQAICAVRQDGCLTELFTTDVDIDILNKEYDLLVNRLDTFLNFDEFRTLEKPSVESGMSSYSFMDVVQKIKNLRAINSYNNGNVDFAVESLLQNYSQLNQAFSLQDTLIGKLVFLRLQSDTLDILSTILSEENVSIEPIEGINRSSDTFKVMFAREFAMAYYLQLEAFQNSELNQDEWDAPDWMVRVFYKPNMSANAKAQIYLGLVELASFPAAKFVKEIDRDDSGIYSNISYRNYIGSILMSITWSAFDRYLVRFIDFEEKVDLFNHIHSHQKDVGEYKNPYYPEMDLEMMSDRICFKGPFQDSEHLRCLRISI